MATQADFSIDQLDRVQDFKGLSPFNFETDYAALFRLFQRK